MLDQVFSCLTAWLAPILCFTAEEAWLSRFGETAGAAPSVHLRLFPEVPAEWRDPALAAKWAKVRQVRRVVTGALELERAEKRIGSSLQAAPRVFIEDPALLQALDGVDMAEISITSAIALEQAAGPAEAFTLEEVAGVAVLPGRAEGDKCGRCWRILPEVGQQAESPELCRRCADVLALA